MNQTKNFYIFTGKGGVGKTTLSLAFSLYLKNQNKNVSFAYFKSGKMDENARAFNEASNLADNLGIDLLPLDLVDSAKAYVAKKLKSKTIAEWVVKTPFFKSLINMIPGFNYLIYVGQILEIIDEEPDRIIVLDAPSSGHAQTMIEAPSNFNDIFKSGELFDDTKKMQKLLTSKDKVKINIISLPGQLPITEAIELRDSLLTVGDFNIDMVCNYAFSKLDIDELPGFLQTKVDIEKNALAELSPPPKAVLPFSSKTSQVELIKDLVPSMESLV